MSGWTGGCGGGGGLSGKDHIAPLWAPRSSLAAFIYLLQLDRRGHVGGSAGLIALDAATNEEFDRMQSLHTQKPELFVYRRGYLQSRTLCAGVFVMLHNSSCVVQTVLVLVRMAELRQQSSAVSDRSKGNKQSSLMVISASAAY